MDMLKGIIGLFKSRKAVGVYITMGVLTYLLITGKLSEEIYAYMVGAVKTMWLGAHTAEERAKIAAKNGVAVVDVIDKVAEVAVDAIDDDQTPDATE